MAQVHLLRLMFCFSAPVVVMVVVDVGGGLSSIDSEDVELYPSLR